MKEKPLVRSQFERERITDTLQAIFLPGIECVKLGDFIHDTYDVMGKLDRLKLDRGLCKKNDSAAYRSQRDKFHGEMLLFADSFLTQHPILLGCGSTIMAWVANDACSPEHLKKISSFFSRLDDVWTKYKKKNYITWAQYEAYFCAAARVPFESYLSHSLHPKVDEILRKALETDARNYIDIFIASAKNESLFPYGNSLLVTNFKSLMADMDHFNRQPNTSRETVYENLLQMVTLAKHLAPLLPDHSTLADPVIKRFSQTWDDLFQMDREMGREGALEVLQERQEYCRSIRRPNKQFVNLLHVKAARFSCTTTSLEILTPKSVGSLFPRKDRQGFKYRRYRSHSLRRGPK